MIEETLGPYIEKWQKYIIAYGQITCANNESEEFLKDTLEAITDLTNAVQAIQHKLWKQP